MNKFPGLFVTTSEIKCFFIIQYDKLSTLFSTPLPHQAGTKLSEFNLFKFSLFMLDMFSICPWTSMTNTKSTELINLIVGEQKLIFF